MTSTIKVNNIQNQCGANIINENSNTITIGASGDTIALASGASQSGFGRTGTVDWQTTIYTNSNSPLTVESGKGYFLNTTSGTITINLPAGSAGDIVALKDYANTWDNNSVTVTPNGSDKIGGSVGSANLSTESQSVTLIFADSTKGWLDIHDSTSNVQSAQYITATGGTVTCTGDFKIHTFTGPGTFCVSNAGNAAGSNKVDYMVVAGGGGGGGRDHGSGGGAGGYRESPGSASCYAASPLGVSPAVALSVPATAYPITVGGGGAGRTAQPCSSGTSGANSVFSTITSAGGGAGGGGPGVGLDGGSGGGGKNNNTQKGSGNTPSVSPPQGNDGGIAGYGSPHYGMGGGGGAGAAGSAGNPSAGGAGGGGVTSSINGTPTARAGGGGGSSYNGGTAGAGGAGGGGTGTTGTSSNGTAGTCNTGGGGGGGERSVPSVGGKNGGSGIVIIRYKFQN